MNSTEDEPHSFPIAGVVSISLLMILALLYQVFVPDHDQGAWLLGLGKGVLEVVIISGLMLFVIRWLLTSDLKITFGDDLSEPPSADDEDMIPHFPDIDHPTWP